MGSEDGKWDGRIRESAPSLLLLPSTFSGPAPAPFLLLALGSQRLKSKASVSLPTSGHGDLADISAGNPAYEPNNIPQEPPVPGL